MHKMRPAFVVTAVYGEGNTVFHVVDARKPEAEQPAIVASYDNLGVYGVWARQAAEGKADRLCKAIGGAA